MNTRSITSRHRRGRWSPGDDNLPDTVNTVRRMGYCERMKIPVTCDLRLAAMREAGGIESRLTCLLRGTPIALQARELPWKGSIRAIINPYNITYVQKSLTSFLFPPAKFTSSVWTSPFLFSRRPITSSPPDLQYEPEQFGVASPSPHYKKAGALHLQIH